MRYRLGLEAAAPDLAYVSHAERYIVGFMVILLIMRYAIWNNKGGVGKSFLTFMLGRDPPRRQQLTRI